jgi:hypothetical protein
MTNDDAYVIIMNEPKLHKLLEPWILRMQKHITAGTWKPQKQEFLALAYYPYEIIPCHMKGTISNFMKKMDMDEPYDLAAVSNMIVDYFIAECKLGNYNA